MLVATVVLPFPLLQNYSYAVPLQWVDSVSVGMRVGVSFHNTTRIGIISRLDMVPYVDKDYKPILFLIDSEPVIYASHIDFWEWLAQYTMATMGDIFLYAIPLYYRVKIRTDIIYNASVNTEEDAFLSLPALHLLTYFKTKPKIELSDLKKRYKGKGYETALKYLFNMKRIYMENVLEEKYKPLTEEVLILNPLYVTDEAQQKILADYKRNKAVQAVFLMYLTLFKKESRPVSVATLQTKVGTSARAAIKKLLNAEIFTSKEIPKKRIPTSTKNILVPPALNEVQTKALTEIRKGFDLKNTVLLYGVSASGKTFIYQHIMIDYLRADKQVLYIVPETAVTLHLVQLLQQTFSGSLLFYTHQTNEHTAYEVWQEILKGSPVVVLATRKGIFLPFVNLGCIIVDDEHDPEYRKRYIKPFFNVRDAAVYYGSKMGVKILLGSATPSLESMYNVRSNKYVSVLLTQRYFVDTQPDITLISMREEVSRSGVISPVLLEKIKTVRTKKEQIILFQNKIGYAPYLLCTHCGFIPKCVQCDVSLTYFKEKNVLRCRYCSQSYPIMGYCHRCLSATMAEKQFGTERVVEYLREKLPDEKVIRLDSDALRGKKKYVEIIEAFTKGEAGIITGTQIVIKGIDVSSVALAAVLDADSLFHFSDFRAGEKAMQTLLQVAGRVARSRKGGDVYIQYKNEELLPLLSRIKTYDYLSFADEELAHRAAFLYPPYSRVIEIIFACEKEKTVMEAAQAYALCLTKLIGKRYVLGPGEPSVAKIRNEFLRTLLLKIPRDNRLLMESKKILRNLQNELIGTTTFKNVRLSFYVD